MRIRIYSLVNYIHENTSKILRSLGYSNFLITEKEVERAVLSYHAEIIVDYYD